METQTLTKTWRLLMQATNMILAIGAVCTQKGFPESRTGEHERNAPLARDTSPTRTQHAQ